MLRIRIVSTRVRKKTRKRMRRRRGSQLRAKRKLVMGKMNAKIEKYVEAMLPGFDTDEAPFGCRAWKGKYLEQKLE